MKIMPALEIRGGNKKSVHNDLKIDMKDDTCSSSQEDLKKLQNDTTILKRIPQGSEATTVLVSKKKKMEKYRKIKLNQIIIIIIIIRLEPSISWNNRR